jgi:hypothetical protein
MHSPVPAPWKPANRIRLQTGLAMVNEAEAEQTSRLASPEDGFSSSRDARRETPTKDFQPGTWSGPPETPDSGRANAPWTMVVYEKDLDEPGGDKP